MVYKDDLTAAHGMIHKLEMENNALKKKKVPEPPKEKKVKCNKCGGWFHRIGGAVMSVVFGLIVLGACAAGSYPLYMALFNSEARGCYMEYKTSSNRYILNQTVDWGNDRTLGEYKTVQEGLDEAKVMQCPMEKDPVLVQ